MGKTNTALTDRTGEPYTVAEVMRLLRLRDDATLRSWRKRGAGPPFFRHGRKHSKILYEREPFWACFER